MSLCTILLILAGCASPATTASDPGAGSGLRSAAPPAERATSPDLRLRSLRSGGRTRWFRVYVPTGYDPGTPAPVVLAYHGGGGNARQFADQSGLCVTAEQEGFLLVFPEGTGVLGGWPFFTLETWNAGNCCGYAQSNGVDDVKFTADMLDALEVEWNVDPGRVFATGHSNGGMMAYRLAIDLPRRIVAIAPNACSLGIGKNPPAPVPVIAFHGKLDCNVPFEGGFGCGVSGTDFLGQRESLAPFFQANGCALPNPLQPAESRGNAHRYEAEAPVTGADIHYWWMIDHGHAWPGHGSAIGDPCNFDIDANDEMWLFFASHHR